MDQDTTSVEPADPSTVDEPTTDDTTPDGADQLGDPGKQALDRMKAERNAARNTVREWQSLARDLGVKDATGLRALIEQAKPADKADAPDPDQIRREATAEALKAANERIVRAEVKAAAGGKLADPADAVRFLDLSTFDVDDDGNVDAEQVADAIADLLKTKPYLAAATATRWQGSADGGARNGKSKPSQLTHDEVKRMSPQQIVQAKAEGRLGDLLAGK